MHCMYLIYSPYLGPIHFVPGALVLLTLLINFVAYNLQTLLSADCATMLFFMLYGISSKMLSSNRV